MKTLLIGDLHCDDQYLEELQSVSKEILTFDADAVIQLGDYYNKHTVSPETLKFGTEFAKKLKDKYKDVTILSGNGLHEWKNNFNVIQYMESLGIKIVGMEYKPIIDGKKCLFGHFMAYDSKLAFGSFHYTEKDLKEYDIAVLAHQHVCQDSQYYSHIGSVFYQTFGEVSDPNKRIGIIENGVLSWIPLKSPIPMIKVTDNSKLNKVKKNTKVKLVIDNFSEFKEMAQDLPKWKAKFKDFVYELKFQKETTEKPSKEINTNKTVLSIAEEINKITDNDVKQLLLEVFEIKL